MTGQDPTSSSRHDLRHALRTYRRRSGRSALQAARTVGWDLEQLLRVESFTRACSGSEVVQLLSSYDAPQEEIDRWRAAGDHADAGPDPTPDSPAFRHYLELERACDGIRHWQPLLVPGLLQTEAYAVAVLEQVYGLTGNDLHRAVRARLKRQQILADDSDRDVRFIVDESVLRRTATPAGTAMPEQLRRLAAVIQRFLDGRSRTQVSFLPSAVGLTPGLAGPFILVEDDRRADAVFLETMTSDRLVHGDEDVVTGFQLTFGRLEELTLSPEACLERLDELLRAHDGTTA